MSKRFDLFTDELQALCEKHKVTININKDLQVNPGSSITLANIAVANHIEGENNILSPLKDNLRD